MRAVLFALVVASLGSAVSASPLAAQQVKRNAVYIEALGSGGAWSLNVERAVGSARLRVGFADWSSSDLFGAGTERFTTLPVTLSYVRGKGRHHLESGGGVTLGSQSFTSSFDGSEERSGFVTLTGLFGYRYQKPEGGFLFRALLTPMYGIGPDDLAYPERGFFPSAGLSVGFVF